MKELERYLQKATQGLWGKKRQEVWQELEGNLNIRIQELQVQGYSQEKAIRQALAEMGDATTINAGMKRVHVMPKMIRSMAALLMALALMVTTLSTQAQLKPTPWKQFLGDNKPSLIRLSDLRQELKRQGIESRLEKQTVLIEEKTTKRQEKRIGLGFSLSKLYPTPVWVPVVEQDGETYVPFSYFVMGVVETGTVVKLEGWDTVKLSFGSYSLNFGAAQNRLNPYDAYIHSMFLESPKDWQITHYDGVSSGCLHAIKVDAPGAVYGLVTRAIYNVPNSFRHVEIARSDANGLVRFYNIQRVLEFADSLKVWDKITNTFVPEKAVLLKFPSEFKRFVTPYTIVMPQQTRSQSQSKTCS